MPRAHADRVRAGARCEAQVAAMRERPHRRARDRGAEETRMGDPTGDAMRFETAADHAGQDPEPVYGSVNLPVYQTATHAQDQGGWPNVSNLGRGATPMRAGQH